MKVVFDTVVFVRALINPKSRCGRLVFEHYADYRLIISAPVAREILEVINRPELKAKYSSLNGVDMARVIDLLGEAEAVELGEIPPVSRDPKDNVFIATALAAGAQYIVSEDEDLKVMGEYQGIKIVDTKTFLELIEGRS